MAKLQEQLVTVLAWRTLISGTGPSLGLKVTQISSEHGDRNKEIKRV